MELTAADGSALRGRLSATVIRPDGSDPGPPRRLERRLHRRVHGDRRGARVVRDPGPGRQPRGHVRHVPYAVVGGGRHRAPAPRRNRTRRCFPSSAGRLSARGGQARPPSRVAAEATWLFYFPQPPRRGRSPRPGRSREAPAPPGPGRSLDHWAFSPSISVPTTDTVPARRCLAGWPVTSGRREADCQPRHGLARPAGTPRTPARSTSSSALTRSPTFTRILSGSTSATSGRASTSSDGLWIAQSFTTGGRADRRSAGWRSAVGCRVAVPVGDQLQASAVRAPRRGPRWRRRRSRSEFVAGRATGLRACSR